MSDLIGRGWAFPPVIDASGGFAFAQGPSDIEQAIRLILLTPKGQRVMRPEFGCQLHDLLFAPNDATTAGLAAYYVEEALRMWEPRIDLVETRAAPDPERPEILQITISYRIRTTLDRRALVFPFYRIPGEE